MSSLASLSGNCPRAIERLVLSQVGQSIAASKINVLGYNLATLFGLYGIYVHCFAICCTLCPRALLECDSSAMTVSICPSMQENSETGMSL